MRVLGSAPLWMLCLGLASTSARVASAAERDPWLGPDKAKHFGASAIIASGAYGASAPLTSSRTARAIVGGTVAFAAGLAKEGWDLAGHGDPSFRDLTWDAIGTGVGVALALVIDLAVRPREVGRAPALPLVFRW